MSPDALWQLALTLLQVLTYTSSLLAAGGALFLLLFPPPDWRQRKAIARYAAALALLGIVVTTLALPLRAGYLNGGGLGGMFDLELIGFLATSPVGGGAALRLAGLSLILALLWERPWASPLAVAGGLVTIGSLTVSGHAAAFESPLLSRSLIALHLAGAAYWLGALWPLLMVTGSSDRRQAAALLERFGTIAMVVVGLLLLAGGALAALFLGSVSALWQTQYGLILMLKLLMAALLLALATLNRFRLVPELAAGRPQASTALRRSIAAELVLALSLLLATAALTTFTSPFG
jgi:copper resistance protein D